MKKLMIATAIVCAAALSQAASCSWQATKVYKDGSTMNGGVAYFMTTSMCSDFAALEGKGVDAVLEALGSAYSYSPSEAGTYTVASGSAVANSALGLSDSTAYSGYLVIFDTETVTADSKFYVSNIKDFETQSGTNNKNILFSSQETASKNAGNWHAVAAVPEPTSGLLLLLGVAGMALRRRRA